MKHFLTKKNIVVIVTFFALIAFYSFTAPTTTNKWELVFENNEYGGNTCGNIDELISYAMNGNDIKVMLHFEAADLHYQMNLSKVRVDLKNKNVTGYNYDVRPNPNEKDVYSRQSSYSTNGRYISITEINNDYRSPEVIKVSMSWYVKI